jgi:hypothetical protein
VLTCGDEEEKARTNFDQAARTEELRKAWGAAEERAARAFEPGAGAGAAQVPARAATSTAAEQFRLLLTRSWREATRNPLRVKAQCGQTLVFSAIISCVPGQSRARGRARSRMRLVALGYMPPP